MFSDRLYRLLGIVCLSGLLFFTMMSLHSSGVQASGIIFVDKNVSGGSNSGTSWNNAYSDLQQALASATAGDEIWVASGIYTPGTKISSTFQLVDGVSVYGGFAATETKRIERDWEQNLTVLSGDLAGDDTTNEFGIITNTMSIIKGITGTNSSHVVTVEDTTGTTILDGFTITAGYANNSNSNGLGGGMYNINSRLTLQNLAFAGNIAGGGEIDFALGGGLANIDSYATLDNVTFIQNAANGYGGGGGGMYNENSKLLLTNVNFIENTTSNFGGRGGGMINDNNSHLTLSNGSFIDNDTRSFADGGGIINQGSITLTNVLFSENTAWYVGGGLYNTSGGQANLVNTAFLGNAARSGAGIYNNGALTLTNSTFSGNIITRTYACSSCDPLNGWGGGLYNSSSHPTRITNSIFWNNHANGMTTTVTATLYTAGGAMPIISSSLIQGSGGSASWNSDYGTDGGNNIDVAPLFVQSVGTITEATSEGDLRLQAGSPAIDVGNTMVYTTSTSATIDLAGEQRLRNDTIDMGAYEYQAGTLVDYTVQVAKIGSGAGHVVSDPAGIDCGLMCAVPIQANTTITLTATANEGSTFTGWSGACSGTTNCIITISEDTSITATFEPTEIQVFLPLVIR